MKLTIILLTGQRHKALTACLRSIGNNNYRGDYEVLVVINGRDEPAVESVKRYKETLPNLRYFTVSSLTPAKARNFALAHTRGEILYFIDDDVILSGNTLKNVLKKFAQYPDLSIIGGPNLTPPGSNLFQRCAGYFLASFWGAARMSQRSKTRASDKFVNDKSLILCNLAMKREIFDRKGFRFNERIICNEENLLLQQLEGEGYRMLFSPEIVVYHQRRGGMGKFFRQILKYGKGRAQQTMVLPAKIPLFVIIPSLFILYLTSLIVYHSPLYLLPLGIYIIFTIFFSFFEVQKERERKLSGFLLMFLLFPAGHVAYGLGFISGFLRR